jgi:hypothetical protein
LEWSDGLDDIFEDNELEWREAIVGYAIRGGLDLEAEGCYGMKWTFNKYSDGGKVEDSKSKDRWALKEKVSYRKSLCEHHANNISDKQIHLEARASRQTAA